MEKKDLADVMEELGPQTEEEKMKEITSPKPNALFKRLATKYAEKLAPDDLLVMRRGRSVAIDEKTGNVAKAAQPWAVKFADTIQEEREKLESQIYDPKYDSTKEVLREFSEQEMIEWKKIRSDMIHLDHVHDFAHGMQPTYEEI
jgi:hypothetical protein